MSEEGGQRVGREARKEKERGRRKKKKAAEEEEEGSRGATYKEFMNTRLHLESPG